MKQPHGSRNPLTLVVLDGWGLRSTSDHNAIALAKTPTYDNLLESFPHTSLITSGEAVGLPIGQMGNSEVGHMNLGAGRVVYQDLTRIDTSIREGEFFKNSTLSDAMDRCLDRQRSLHLIGLVSDGGVHSHENHLYALLKMAKKRRIPQVFVHVITDGRDTPPLGGRDYVGQLEQLMSTLGTGRIATVIGRYFAMDRDNRWERTQIAYDAITRGLGKQEMSAIKLIEASYESGTADEFIMPSVMMEQDGEPVGPLREEDSVVFFNFRADRARQLTQAIAFKGFNQFDRIMHPQVHMATMTSYDANYGLKVAFEPQAFSSTLGEVLGKLGLTNLRLAETEKYAHVTYFFNCGEERPQPGEERVLVPSPKVATYDLQPEMSAKNITLKLTNDIKTRAHDVTICNFANADMVGHTGKLDAAILAVQTLDRCLTDIVKTAISVGGSVLVTADHGNAEQMWNAEKSCPHTAHTDNPVPLILIGQTPKGEGLRNGSLRDVAPTLLGILGIKPPEEMTGRDLRTWTE
jgi:2,3-bisphosphoglycerate-independent phosphoglycerate mutase